MKNVVLLGAFLVVLLAGCATTEPIWFIATPGYVETRIATSEEATREEYEARIAELQSELDQQRRVSGELSRLADQISEISATNAELLDLADEVEAQLQDLPEETIRQLVEILQAHLDETATE